MQPSGRGGLLFLLLVFFTLFILVDIAILAYWLWPEREQAPAAPAGRTAPARPAVVPAVPAGQDSVEQRDGPQADAAVRAARAAWLEVQAEAEAADIAAWGGAGYDRVTGLAAAAEAAARKGERDGAVRDFTAAAHGLKKLLADRTALFARDMDQGLGALAAGRAGEARQAFTLALALDPASGQARHGLERAASLDRVLALMAEGAAREQQGDPEAALASYRAAAGLAPEYAPAVQARQRLARQLEERGFRRAMGRFFTALDRDDLDEAASALAAAAALRPDDPAVADGGRSLQAARQTRRLAALEQEFTRLARAEEWDRVLAVCDKALAISDQAAFAVAGRRLAGERRALARAMDRILADPLRLQEEGPLAEARRTLAVARAVADPGPRLRAGIDALEQVLERAVIPVPVSLRSDGATSVVIHRVGRLGRFTEKRLRLRPGRYTVVGTRPGYRDVRRTLVVDGNSPPPPLLIRCEEPI